MAEREILPPDNNPPGGPWGVTVTQSQFEQASLRRSLLDLHYILEGLRLHGSVTIVEDVALLPAEEEE